MAFRSILFYQSRRPQDRAEEPAFFSDLNLDQVVDAITAPKKEYNLKPFFYLSLHDIDTIRYRQEVMKDLEDAMLIAGIKSFANKMATVRRYLALTEDLDFDYHKKGWFLEAVLVYCGAVVELVDSLNRGNQCSRGLLAFRKYLLGYVRSLEFQSLKREAERVKGELKSVRYCLVIRSGKFSVRELKEETDYSLEIEKVFDKFRQGAVKNYLVNLPVRTGMNHIEAKILEFVSWLFPEPFATLDQFCTRYSQFMDETINNFDREVQFYVAYLEFIEGLRQKGLPFCYPEVSTTCREETVRGAFDVALANSFLSSDRSVVCNDFSLKGAERVIVISGPNQGGKTTFARMFGQLHYLASLGCPVAGNEARLFIPDRIFTHFEQEEDIRSLRGKLQDDLLRIHSIVTHATQSSVIILNEIFSSTTLEDAIFLSKEIMSRIISMDVLCVWVTFIDELSRLSEKTVSMVSTVDPSNPMIRTFKIVRKRADGLTYALSVAQKHCLTYEQIKERIQP